LKIQEDELCRVNLCIKRKLCTDTKKRVRNHKKTMRGGHTSLGVVQGALKPRARGQANVEMLLVKGQTRLTYFVPNKTIRTSNEIIWRYLTLKWYALRKLFTGDRKYVEIKQFLSNL